MDPHASVHSQSNKMVSRNFVHFYFMTYYVIVLFVASIEVTPSCCHSFTFNFFSLLLSSSDPIFTFMLIYSFLCCIVAYAF